LTHHLSGLCGPHITGWANPGEYVAMPRRAGRAQPASRPRSPVAAGR